MNATLGNTGHVITWGHTRFPVASCAFWPIDVPTSEAFPCAFRWPFHCSSLSLLSSRSGIGSTDTLGDCRRVWRTTVYLVARARAHVAIALIFRWPIYIAAVQAHPGPVWRLCLFARRLVVAALCHWCALASQHHLHHLHHLLLAASSLACLAACSHTLSSWRVNKPAGWRSAVAHFSRHSTHLPIASCAQRKIDIATRSACPRPIWRWTRLLLSWHYRLHRLLLLVNLVSLELLQCQPRLRHAAGLSVAKQTIRIILITAFTCPHAFSTGWHTSSSWRFLRLLCIGSKIWSLAFGRSGL